MMKLNGRQTCFELMVHLMKSEVWGGAYRAQGSRAEKLVLVPLQWACSAFKGGWLRALMSPQPTLRQTCWSKLPFASWNSHLHELALFCGDLIQKARLTDLLPMARDRWTSFRTSDNDGRRPSAKWCLWCFQCWALPYMKLFESGFNAYENKMSLAGFAFCFAKWAP